MTDPAFPELKARFDALVAEETVPTIGDRLFLSILQLDSGMHYGLLDDLTWAVHARDQLQPFQPGHEKHFVEVLEHRRNDFEQQLEQRAAALELPVDPLVLSFPALPLVQAMLKSEAAHFVRLGLLWLLPSELRELREPIQAIAADDKWPGSLRDLAERLVVPV